MDFGDFEDNGFPVAEDDFGAQDAADLFGATEDLVQKAVGIEEEAGAIVAASATADALEDLDYDLPPVKVVNLIATADVSSEVDLRLLTISTRNIEYNPKRVNAAIVRLRAPRSTIMVFPNGRLTILGTRSEDAALMAAKVVAKTIKLCGHAQVRFARYRVETLVCCAFCGFPVRLENLAKDHSRYSNYEPEIFCGLVYRYHPQGGPKASVLIFVSGRLIITGTKNTADAQEVYKNLYAVLYPYRA